MENLYKNPTFCQICGRIVVLGKCPKHKDQITKEARQKIGKWSGPSKSPNKFNDYK